jgi:RhoGEF, Guanine nucleotide exchange factor for Rho/Rac/Cdc42-like GTPases
VDHTPHVLIYGVEIDSPNRIKYKDTYDNLNMMEYYKESMPLGNILQQKPTYVACGSNFTFYVNHQGSVSEDKLSSK